ncbi:putative uncharacterized protein DDB_G0275317 [Microplitis demolitor]|uniref:putative uncharacterized protein DDB_G0275317 n=1 Tax=Microplitis demolitor TaxID=69319 RepID=UPI00235B5FC4|nr:putative uncharacterized protein DDB_G0275317 [Microplitis demolitor]
MDHNHLMKKKHYDHLPKPRRMSPEEKKKVEELLSVNDKSLTERDALKNSLLSFKVNLIKSAYHTLRAFNLEITTEKRHITPTARDEAKKILQELVYAETEENYQKLHGKLKTMPQSIVDYFDTNWHEDRKEWSLSSNNTQHNFLNGTNNPLESLNAKIKKDLNRYISLKEFVKQILIFMECSHKERDHKATVSYQKSRSLPYDSAEYRWTRNYYFGAQTVFRPSEDQPEIPESVLSSITFKKKVLLEHQKYRKANEVEQKLPSLVAGPIIEYSDDEDRNDISDNDENIIRDNDKKNIGDIDENDFDDNNKNNLEDNDDNGNVVDDDDDDINYPDDNRDDNDRNETGLK